MKPFQSPDGTSWGVDVRMATHSGALVVFHHPGGSAGRPDRYAWINVRRPEASDPRAQLGAEALAGQLDARELARLFRRSMPVQADRPSYVVS